MGGHRRVELAAHSSTREGFDASHDVALHVESRHRGAGGFRLLRSGPPSLRVPRRWRPAPGDGQFGPPGTGLGIVEIYRNDTSPPRLIGYVTKDNSGVSYWLLNGSEVAPPLPTAGTKVTFQKLNDNDVNIETWCATPKPGTSPAQTYGGTLSSPVIRRLDPTSSTSCP